MDKNDVIVAECVGLGTQGEGIVKADGITLFVPFLLAGERAEIRILKLKNGIGYGKVERLLSESPSRISPACGVFGKCGGCALQHMEYGAQLAFKTGLVRDTLKKIGRTDAAVSPCTGSGKPYGYRNKLQLPIGRRNGENVVGFFAERSHRIVPTMACPIHPDWSEKLISALYTYMEKCGVDGYDEETGDGTLRHIVVRELQNRYLVTLVATDETVAGLDEFCALLDGIFPEYSLCVNVNTARTNVIFGKDFRLVKGSGFYECEEGGIVFEAGVNTFVQVNESVRGKLYERVVSCVKAGETVVDCYSGGGLLTAMLAKKCGRAIGIEIVPEASACADKVKEKNGLEGKMLNYCGKVEELLRGVLEKEKNATIVLDPPRSGVEPNVLEALSEYGAERILYVSCNPATLARDIGILTGKLPLDGKERYIASDGGMYEVELAQPYDMFPQTRHVETLVSLRRR